MNKDIADKNYAYASHMMIIASLARAINEEVVHIVELGCGLYSTPMWLNRALWPNVKTVISYEHSDYWARRMGYIMNDERLSICDHYPVAVKSADIILVDNGSYREQRVEGIEHVVKQKPSGLVILHDANEPQYLEAIEPHFEHCIVYSGAYPHTALLWNGDRFDYDEIEASIMIVRSYECPNLT